MREQNLPSALCKNQPQQCWPRSWLVDPLLVQQNPIKNDQEHQASLVQQKKQQEQQPALANQQQAPQQQPEGVTNPLEANQWWCSAWMWQPNQWYINENFESIPNEYIQGLFSDDAFLATLSFHTPAYCLLLTKINFNPTSIYWGGDRDVIHSGNTQRVPEYLVGPENYCFFTDPKNLTLPTTGHASNHIQRWWWLIEEFGPEIQAIKIPKNVVADALLQLEVNFSIAYSNEN